MTFKEKKWHLFYEFMKSVDVGLVFRSTSSFDHNRILHSSAHYLKNTTIKQCPRKIHMIHFLMQCKSYGNFLILCPWIFLLMQALNSKKKKFLGEIFSCHKDMVSDFHCLKEFLHISVLKILSHSCSPLLFDSTRRALGRAFFIP